jgi:hypothetical protein
MLKSIGLTAVLLVAGALPAFAEDTCQLPPVPASVDGTTASKDQILAGIKASKDYIAASDTYQQCINDYVTAAKADADKNKKPVDPAIIQVSGDKITANQNNKQKVGDQINSAIGAYKKAHPG